MRNCPRCLNTSVIEDGYCGVCRECTLPPLPPQHQQQAEAMARECEQLRKHLEFERHELDLLLTERDQLRTREAALMKQLEDAKLPTVEHIQDIYELTKLRAQNVALMTVASAAKDYADSGGSSRYTKLQDSLTALTASGIELDKV